MTPEKLKVIAEGMGYVELVSDNYKLKGRLIVWNGKDIHTRQAYKPDTTNNDQMVEIMENLNIQLRRQTHKPKGLWVARIEYVVNPMTVCQGKTINEAVCSTAYEHYKAVK